jgi:hypothetical protein
MLAADSNQEQGQGSTRPVGTGECSGGDHMRTYSHAPESCDGEDKSLLGVDTQYDMRAGWTAMWGVEGFMHPMSAELSSGSDAS